MTMEGEFDLPILVDSEHNIVERRTEVHVPQIKLAREHVVKDSVDIALLLRSAVILVDGKCKLDVGRRVIVAEIDHHGLSVVDDTFPAGWTNRSNDDVGFESGARWGSNVGVDQHLDVVPSRLGANIGCRVRASNWLKLATDQSTDLREGKARVDTVGRLVVC